MALLERENQTLKEENERIKAVYEKRIQEMQQEMDRL